MFMLISIHFQNMHFVLNSRGAHGHAEEMPAASGKRGGDKQTKKRCPNNIFGWNVNFFRKIIPSVMHDKHIRYTYQSYHVTLQMALKTKYIYPMSSHVHCMYIIHIVVV